ncbi:MAG TPA: DUF1993 domain-containing protein [Polyangiaceae bacterium]|jgi:hypothetical protein|nr:DUF1993 domain-containing protein [Polyangiaceae bacterium]
MSNVHANVAQFTKMLKNLDNWIEKGVALAQAKKFEPGVLLESRLAPDMLPLVRQIQASCDGVKFYCARLSGKEPPKHPDTEKTVEELRARIKSVLDYVGTFKESDFNGAEERAIPLTFMPGKGLRGKDFMNEMNVPNTYFHLCMAYAILRHNGVDVGKQDFIGSLNMIDL